MINAGLSQKENLIFSGLKEAVTTDELNINWLINPKELGVFIKDLFTKYFRPCTDDTF